jgi:hypothetical protein
MAVAFKVAWLLFLFVRQFILLQVCGAEELTPTTEAGKRPAYFYRYEVDKKKIIFLNERFPPAYPLLLK